jgi:hypothetical protein
MPYICLGTGITKERKITTLKPVIPPKRLKTA